MNLRNPLTTSSVVHFVCRAVFVLAIAATLPKAASAFTCNEAINVASAANGATATASSSASGFAASGAINGDRKGLFVWQDGY